MSQDQTWFGWVARSSGWRRADAAAGRAVRGPRVPRPALGTSSSASRGRSLPRAGWRGPRLGRHRRSARSSAYRGSLGARPVQASGDASPAPAWVRCRASADASGRVRPVRRPGSRTAGRLGLRHRPRRSPTSVVLFVGEGSQGDPQDLVHLFLDFDDHLGLLQLPLQARDLLLLLLHSRIYGLGLRAALAPSQRGQGPLLPLAAPGRQQRRVQTLTPQQSAQLAGALQASACFKILSRYSAVKRRRFGFATTSGSGAPPASAETPVALRAPSVSAACFISEPDPAASRSIHLSLPAPYTNLGRLGVSRIIGTGGSSEKLKPFRCSANVEGA